MLTRDELQVVADLAIEHDVIVVTDEVYEHLVFDDARSGEGHVPIATLPGMWERTLTLSSAGKSLLLHGLEGRLGHRPGAARAGGARGQAVADLHLGIAAAAGRRARARPRARLAEGAGPRPAVAARPARATASPRPAWRRGCRRAPTSPPPTSRHLGWADGREFCLALPERAGVVAIPTQGFYDDPEAGRQLVRWAFCKQPDVISEGVRRLAAADLAR